jgi:carboxymethylenebutenolidase
MVAPRRKKKRIMETRVHLTAEDGHRLGAYLNHTPNAKMGVVVLQEIFGVNHHIRSVVDRFAAEGFTAVAPALFDREKPDVELGYDKEAGEEGRKLAYAIPREKILKDIDAAIHFARREMGGGKVGVVGYCFGGSYAWFSATGLRPDAAVGYYGSMVAKTAGESSPHCPVMLHFGAKDEHIPVAETTERIRTAHPEIPVYVYDAGHGFSCNERPGFSPEADALAWSRTIAFLKEHLAA